MKIQLNKKISINNFFFLIFFILYLISLNLLQLDLVGSISIVFVAFITFIYTKVYRSLATILYLALAVRLIVILLGHHFVILPDSWGDATIFELKAWQMSQDGFFAVFDKFPSNKTSLSISWVLAFFYSLTDRSVIMGQSLSLLFGMGSVLLGSHLANKIWSEKISIKVGWIIALYPTLILYSSLILREAYVWFFLLVSIYGIIFWFKNEIFKALLFLLIGFSGATFFQD